MIGKWPHRPSLTKEVLLGQRLDQAMAKGPPPARFILERTVPMGISSDDAIECVVHLLDGSLRPERRVDPGRSWQARLLPTLRARSAFSSCCAGSS